MPDYPDIYFAPEYQELFRDTAFGGEPCHFNHVGVDYRYYKRPIEGTPYFDVVSPYGYSGPVEVKSGADWPWFLENLHSYFYNTGIIAEFARLHPFIEQWLAGHYERDIVYIDLTQSLEQIWKGFDKGCKSAIKGGDTDIFAYAGVPSDFRQLYRDTMQARSAAKGYLFDDRFFTRLSPLAVTIGNPRQMAIVLLWGDYAHYFLAAGHGKSSNAIVWESIRWAKSQGCKIFNLGGGLKAGDSLESFKRSFSHTTKPFFTYRKIHNLEAYNEVCKIKGIDPASQGFFPAYRRDK